MTEDCYFFEEDARFRCLCVECHEKFPDLGALWKGSVHGYGPFLFKCCKCEKTVYDPDSESDHNEMEK